MKWIKKTWIFLDGFKRIVGITLFSFGGILSMANDFGWFLDYSETAKLLMIVGAVLANIGSAFALNKRKQEVTHNGRNY